MNSELITVVIVGTTTLCAGCVFIIMLVLTYQKRILRKNREMFLAVMRSQELEQQRIGQDLHDSLSPLISAIRLKTGMIEMKVEDAGVDFAPEFANLDILLIHSSRLIRETSHNLMPVALKDGLIAALEDYVSGIQHPNFCVSLYTHGFPAMLNELADVNLYRIIQELTHNAIKHSKGTSVKIFLFSFQQENIQLIVKDNGVGISKREVGASTSGMGHQNIENRVRLLEGTYIFYHVKPSGMGIHLKFDMRKWK